MHAKLAGILSTCYLKQQQSTTRCQLAGCLLGNGAAMTLHDLHQICHSSNIFAVRCLLHTNQCALVYTYAVDVQVVPGGLMLRRAAAAL
jgi:hypothetical protein